MPLCLGLLAFCHSSPKSPPRLVSLGAAFFFCGLWCPMRGGRGARMRDPAVLPALRLFWQARTPQRPSTYLCACCVLTSYCKGCWPPRIGLSLFALKAAKLLAALPTGTSLRYILSTFSACYDTRCRSQARATVVLDNTASVLRLLCSIMELYVRYRLQTCPCLIRA